jgi:GNAT superfamily N-acetyltransferase
MSDGSPGLVIRPYEPSDHGAVQALVVDINRELAPAAMRAAFEDYIARSLSEEIDRIPEYYGGRGGGFWVATEDAAVVGTFGLERMDTDAAELRRMYVARDRRRRGIARLMLQRAEELCRKAGCRRLTLGTSELPPAAIELYRRSGYRQVREEVSERETNKAIAGLRRFYFEKELRAGDGS